MLKSKYKPSFITDRCGIIDYMGYEVLNPESIEKLQVIDKDTGKLLPETRESLNLNFKEFMDTNNRYFFLNGDGYLAMRKDDYSIQVRNWYSDKDNEKIISAEAIIQNPAYQANIYTEFSNPYDDKESVVGQRNIGSIYVDLQWKSSKQSLLFEIRIHETIVEIINATLMEPRDIINMDECDYASLMDSFKSFLKGVFSGHLSQKFADCVSHVYGIYLQILLDYYEAGLPTIKENLEAYRDSETQKLENILRQQKAYLNGLVDIVERKINKGKEIL